MLSIYRAGYSIHANLFNMYISPNIEIYSKLCHIGEVLFEEYDSISGGVNLQVSPVEGGDLA